MLAIILLFVGIASRLIDHSPNFTPIISLALFSGIYLPRKHALWLPLALMILSDLVIGFHDTIIYTWGSVVLITWIGMKVRDNKSLASILTSNLAGAVLFFIITNLGAWPTLYPMTWQGLTDCFVMAIPFFRNTFYSTILYSVIFFGAYEFIAVRVKRTRWASALLSV